MLKTFEGVVSRAKELMGNMSVKQFANKLGMTQQTVDLYVKGARKPSVEFIYNICSSFGVSADWLLGLPDRGGSAGGGESAPGAKHQAPSTKLPAPSSKLQAPSSSPPPDCSRCQLMAAHVREITGRK